MAFLCSNSSTLVVNFTLSYYTKIMTFLSHSEENSWPNIGAKNIFPSGKIKFKHFVAFYDKKFYDISKFSKKGYIPDLFFFYKISNFSFFQFLFQFSMTNVKIYIGLYRSIYIRYNLLKILYTISYIYLQSKWLP